MSSMENPDIKKINDLIKAAEDAENLMALIIQLIKEKQYEGIALLFTSDKEAAKNREYLPKLAMDLYHDICLPNLNDEVYQKNHSLYSCCEELLKTLASYAPLEEITMELLVLVEDNKSEYVFTSALRALQVVLFRQGDQKPRTLGWSLRSIYTRLESLKVPDYFKEGYDRKQQQLLEQDEDIQILLMHYITVGLFYDPLLQNICSQPRGEKEVFKCLGITRRNLFCCFLIELLGKPLSLLDLSNGEDKMTNTYSLQCARSLTQGVTKCIIDPLFLLSFVEYRERFMKHKGEEREVGEMNSNIFLIPENLSFSALAVYYYMVIVEGVDSKHIPLVYNPLYILESCLYLVYELLLHEEPPLQEKALLLIQQLLKNLKNQQIPSSYLEMQIHKLFCHTLCYVIGYSAQTHLRQLGLKILRHYILSFEDEGKYLILKNLMKTVSHHGITGYLAILYKDLVAEALKNSTSLPVSFSGKDFRSIFLQNICKLSHGVETDLIENSDRIISSLNAIRYFAIKDIDNRTGFWNFSSDINQWYLMPLRQAMDLSQAHFKAQIRKVERGLPSAELSQLNLLDIAVANDKQTKLDLQFDREKQLRILNQNLCTFDLMRSLLSRVCECLENSPVKK